MHEDKPDIPNEKKISKSKKTFIKWGVVCAGIAAVLTLGFIIYNSVQINSSYNKAVALVYEGRFAEADNAARQIRSREFREKYYKERNSQAAKQAEAALADGDIDSAYRLADIISDTELLREFNIKFYPEIYRRAVIMFDSGQQEEARSFMEKYASKSYEYTRKFNQYAGTA